MKRLKRTGVWLIASMLLSGGLAAEAQAKGHRKHHHRPAPGRHAGVPV